MKLNSTEDAAQLIKILTKLKFATKWLDCWEWNLTKAQRNEKKIDYQYEKQKPWKQKQSQVFFPMQEATELSD